MNKPTVSFMDTTDQRSELTHERYKRYGQSTTGQLQRKTMRARLGKKKPIDCLL